MCLCAGGEEGAAMLHDPHAGGQSGLCSVPLVGLHGQEVPGRTCSKTDSYVRLNDICCKHKTMFSLYEVIHPPKINTDLEIFADPLTEFSCAFSRLS